MFLHGNLKLCLVIDRSDELPEFSTGDQIHAPTRYSYLLECVMLHLLFSLTLWAAWDNGSVNELVELEMELELHG